MTDQVVVMVPRPKFNEGSAFTATAYCHDRATAAASVPSAAKYRIDCLTTNRTVQDWTTLTPAASISISISGAVNAIIDSSNESEKKQITVASNPEAADQFRDTAVWEIVNLQGSP